MTSLDCEAICARQSIADLSSVVIFLACDGLGIEGSTVRGFRGPGRFDPRVDVAVDNTAGLGSTAGDTDGDGGLSPFVVSSPFSEEGVVAVAGRGDQRGHFFASSDSSGTSTTSLYDSNSHVRAVTTLRVYFVMHEACVG